MLNISGPALSYFWPLVKNVKAKFEEPLTGSLCLEFPLNLIGK